MTDRDHDFSGALATRVAEHIETLPDDERQRARAAMGRGEVYVRRDGNDVEVVCGHGDDAVTVSVHRLSIGPRPRDADDN